MKYVDDETVLFVLSDHGFTSFERGADMNSWLLQNGYLALNQGATGGRQYLKDVDWSRTRAYTFGLAGIYINLKGREALGVVSPGAEAAALKREIAANYRAFATSRRTASPSAKSGLRTHSYRPVSGRRSRLDRRLCRWLPRVLGCCCGQSHPQRL